MASNFMIYGSNGFVGKEIARIAAASGLNPILAGRNGAEISAQAAELGASYRVFGLDNPALIAEALADVDVLLHCAGPYIHTFKPMVEACLRTNTHYLDITGEIPVYQGIASRDEEAKAAGVMLLPGVGFDVVPTDCLAAHLKRRLPSATHLSLAFHSQGRAGFPPGTAKTMVEMIPYGVRLRRNGQLIEADGEPSSRMIDFGNGPRSAVMLSWGDIFMAYHSTGIPNIINYASLGKEMEGLMKATSFLRPLFKLGAVRSLAKRLVPAGSTAEERAKSRVHVWGEVKDDQGRKAVSRLHGPEAGVIWTSQTALAVVRKILNGEFKPGFQTPSMAYGPDFVLEGEGISREDLE